ncbi:MAG: NUDIX domain-containing protein [Gallionella sp.]|nr:NUDIX domain-containing protein [Gallionella sp.]MDD4959363.1 NUDIX domain-containing protein [Gallionella sp.]
MTQSLASFDPHVIERPLTTVDVVIFTVLDQRLHVLLVLRPDTPEEPFKGMRALPGGFVDMQKDDDLESCARRKLQQKTGVRSPYLEQVGSWGGIKRDPRGWSATHVYFALLPATESPEDGAPSSDAKWFPIENQRVSVNLAFDHAKLLEAAIQRLRNKVEYTSLPAYLLPEEFTLSDLQHMYEVVLERSIEKSAFRTRVFAANLVEPIDKVRAGPNRPAQLYRLSQPKEIVYFPRTFSPRKV